MNYRIVAVIAMALCLGFTAAGIVSGQDDEKEELLSVDDFHKLMDEDIKGAFGDARTATKNKSAKELAAAANNLESHAGKIIKYSGPELTSEDPARENKDFKKLIDSLKEAAADLAKHAENGDWDKVEESLGEVGKSCGGCHDGFRTLDEDKYLALMEDDIKTAWSKLKISARNKMGENAAQSADDIAKFAPKILGYEGKVLRGKNKDQLARHQKDFQEWVEDLIEAAGEYAKYARKGDWEKADEAKDKINDTCSNCHDEYEPED